MVENMRIIGAAVGVIIAIIITPHMTTSAPTSTQLQACTAGMAMPGIVGMSCIALLPDEASGQIDVDDVVLARDRVLQSITAALAHAVDAKRALAPAALDGDLLFQESDDLEGRSEQLPRHPTELPGEDLGQRL